MSVLHASNPWVLATWLIITIMLVVPGAPSLLPSDNGSPVWFQRWLLCSIIGGLSGWMAWQSALDIGGLSKFTAIIMLILMLTYWFIFILLSLLLFVSGPETEHRKTA